MLDVERLSVSFLRYSGFLRRSRFIALRDISVAVAPGEVLGVIGGSGAGKSLLAQAIMGILPRNAECNGEIRFRGEVLGPERIASLRGRQIALMPQSIAALDPLARVRAQVAWAAARAGMPKQTISLLAQKSLERFGLDGNAGRSFPHELSGGMARRILMAIATAGAADLLIVDEPTTGLDPENVATMMAHLRAWAEQGRAALVITHDLGAILPIADRITVVHEGTSIETAPATAFRGPGLGLRTDYARALWRALPQNQFSGPAGLAAA